MGIFNVSSLPEDKDLVLVLGSRTPEHFDGTSIRSWRLFLFLEMRYRVHSLWCWYALHKEIIGRKTT